MKFRNRVTAPLWLITKWWTADREAGKLSTGDSG